MKPGEWATIGSGGVLYKVIQRLTGNVIQVLGVMEGTLYTYSWPESILQHTKPMSEDLVEWRDALAAVGLSLLPDAPEEKAG